MIFLVECDCEPDGTIDEGICDGYNNEEEGLVAGKCHCKEFVGGPRCDKCINGYWNRTAENPQGCQGLLQKHDFPVVFPPNFFFQFAECKCNIAGIVSNDGCDQVTGSCTCKRFVTGRDCDQCMEEHYGLSESDPNGCTPCDCDVGGAYDNHCDVLTGQCKCRPEVKGRRCDEVKDGYFTGALDYLLFEGELAHGSQNPVSSIIKKILIKIRK